MTNPHNKNEINGYNLSYPAKIPLDLILLSNGYKFLAHKSSRLNPVLESEGGHRVVISLMSSGDYLYFNPNDDKDRGNIYNLCKNNGLDIKELLESFFENPIERDYQLATKDSKDYKQFIEEFLNLPNYDINKNFLLQNRKLSKEIIERYSNSIKADSNHNVYFPQYKTIKVSDNISSINIRGYTKKLSSPIWSKNGERLNKPIKSLNQGLKGIEILLPNSLKDKQDKQDKSSINIQHNTEKHNVIISESSIDSLSFAEIAKMPNAILLGTSGNINFEELKNIIIQINENFNIDSYFMCFDKDEMGEKFKNSFRQMGFELNLTMRNTQPLTKDFNDDLKLLKILKLDNDTSTSQSIYGIYNGYYDGGISNIEIKQKIDRAIEWNLIDNFQYSSKNTQVRQDCLKKLRMLDSIYPIKQNLKDKFNHYQYKDKRIREI